MIATTERQANGLQSGDSPQPEISEEIIVIARKIAWRTVYGYGLPLQDHDDIAQDLLLELLKARRLYKPDRGTWVGFASVVMRTRALTIAAYRTRCFRDSRNWHELEHDPQTESAQQSVELRIDMQEAISRLSGERKVVIEGLRLPIRKEQLPVQLGITKSRLYTVIGKIRESLSQTGVMGWVTWRAGR